MINEVKNKVNNMSNYGYYIWQDELDKIFGIARLCDEGIELSERQRKCLNRFLEWCEDE